MTPSEFLGNNGEQQVIEAIRTAENNTSGEIKVHLEKICDSDPVKAAQQMFHRLKMDNTKEKNGVLIYVAIESHKFAIIGDEGINEKVGEEFWHEVKEVMQRRFRESKFAIGLVEGILLSGKKLAEYFPWDRSDENELSDEISTG